MRQQIGDVTLIHGDCLDVMPTLAAGSVAFVFADLPYGVTRREWDTPIDLTALWSSIDELSKGNDCVVVATATQPFATKLIASRINQFRYDLIWDKNRTTGFLNANRMPLRRHESVLVFYKRLGTYNPQKSDGKPYKMTRGAPDLNYGHVADNKPVQVSDGPRHPTSIIRVPSGTAGSCHPTQKPIALLEWLIKTYTNDGDTILDPVAGSGTTACAALRVGNRKVVCIEKNKAYYDAMVARVAAEHVKVAT